MVLEQQPPPFLEWFFGSPTELGALPYWLMVLAVIGLVGILISFVLTAVAHGPNRAGDIIFKVLSSGLGDVLRASPRRVLALAWLAVQESLRRRVLVGLAVFLVILLFAGWFLNQNTPNPAELYLSFVLTTTTYLVMLVALLLSAFSLPNDIQNRTIYTIVTKPVRPTEVVFGRTLGFVAIGTALLAVMGVGSYFFVVRTLSHTHELLGESLLPPDSPSPSAALAGRTEQSAGHRHHVTVDANGAGVTETVQHHWHEVRAIERNGVRQYELSPPRGQLNARVPLYGKLRFLDRTGHETREGINVGNEWTYRSYVEGGTSASAIWQFQNLREADFPEGLRLEMTIRVFRTYKGEIDKGILGSITLRNPTTGAKRIARTFLAKEYQIDQHVIPLEFKDTTGRPVNLFDDLVSDGNLEIELKCLQRAQFFGMAQPDAWILPREGTFETNFVKGFVGIWLQMVLITSLGVMWSTFLNGPVAMLATAASLVLGFYVEKMQDLAANRSLGGGTFESLIRIVTQNNLTSQLDQNVTNTVATSLDTVGRVPLFVVSRLLPNLPSFSDVQYVAEGFDIPANLLAIHLVTGLGYALPTLIAGFIFFKVREVAK